MYLPPQSQKIPEWVWSNPHLIPNTHTLTKKFYKLSLLKLNSCDLPASPILQSSNSPFCTPSHHIITPHYPDLITELNHSYIATYMSSSKQLKPKSKSKLPILPTTHSNLLLKCTLPFSLPSVYWPKDHAGFKTGPRVTSPALGAPHAAVPEHWACSSWSWSQWPGSCTVHLCVQLGHTADAPHVIFKLLKSS